MKQWWQTHSNALPRNGEYERVAGSEKYKCVTEKKNCRGEIRSSDFFTLVLWNPRVMRRIMASE